MEIEIRNRKMIFVDPVVYDRDDNAEIWTFVLPETLLGHPTNELSGYLGVLCDNAEGPDRLTGTRQGRKFTFTVPAGVFTGAHSAAIQFYVTGEDFAWYSEILTLNVIACLDPEESASERYPVIIEALQEEMTELSERLDGLTDGNTVLARARCDKNGNEIGTTYATKAEMQTVAEDIPTDYVPQTRKVAGVALSADVGKAALQNALFDASHQTVTSEEKEIWNAGRQMDDIPLPDSAFPVKSSGVYAAVKDANALVRIDVGALLGDMDHSGSTEHKAAAAALVSAAIAEAWQNRPQGASHANICLYNAPAGGYWRYITFLSHCNYYDLAPQSGDDYALDLYGLTDCTFVRVRSSAETVNSYLMRVTNCTDLVFTDCIFRNVEGTAAVVDNSDRILFDNCVFMRGSNYSMHDAFLEVKNTGSAFGALRVRDCVFSTAMLAGESPDRFTFVKTTGVTNAKYTVFLSNCFLDAPDRKITAQDVSDPHGRIVVTAEEAEVAALRAETTAALSEKADKRVLDAALPVRKIPTDVNGWERNFISGGFPSFSEGKLVYTAQEGRSGSVTYPVLLFAGFPYELSAQFNVRSLTLNPSGGCYFGICLTKGYKGGETLLADNRVTDFVGFSTDLLPRGITIPYGGSVTEKYGRFSTETFVPEETGLYYISVFTWGVTSCDAEIADIRLSTDTDRNMIDPTTLFGEGMRVRGWANPGSVEDFGGRSLTIYNQQTNAYNGWGILNRDVLLEKGKTYILAGKISCTGAYSSNFQSGLYVTAGDDMGDNSVLSEALAVIALPNRVTGESTFNRAVTFTPQKTDFYHICYLYWGVDLAENEKISIENIILQEF